MLKKKIPVIPQLDVHEFPQTSISILITNPISFPLNSIESNDAQKKDIRIYTKFQFDSSIKVPMSIPKDPLPEKVFGAPQVVPLPLRTYG